MQLSLSAIGVSKEHETEIFEIATLRNMLLKKSISYMPTMATSPRAHHLGNDNAAISACKKVFQICSFPLII